MLRFVCWLSLAISAFNASLAFSNYVHQSRIVQIGVRRCAELATKEANDLCMDILDLRTLQTITIRLPRPDRGM